MVNIDTIYQKVLMFANKEQRGYITPQEFNLFADQAQVEIFEQYFYDIDFHAKRMGNSTEYSDLIHNINEKVTIFEKTAPLVGGSLNAIDLYRLGTVSSGGVEVEQVQQNEILYLLSSPLTQPTLSRPVYVRNNTIIQIYPTTVTTGTYTYVRKPTKPNWSYVVVNSKAMYDNSQAVHFELHQSEESELVYKILKFAGVSMKKDDIMRAGQGMEAAQIQQEKQ